MNDTFETLEPGAADTSLDKASLIAGEFRAFMCEMSESEDPRATTTFYELAASLGAGHSCLDLTTLAKKESLEEWKTFLRSLSVVTDVTNIDSHWRACDK